MSKTLKQNRMRLNARLDWPLSLLDARASRRTIEAIRTDRTLRDRGQLRHSTGRPRFALLREATAILWSWRNGHLEDQFLRRVLSRDFDRQLTEVRTDGVPAREDYVLMDLPLDIARDLQRTLDAVESRFEWPLENAVSAPPPGPALWVLCWDIREALGRGHPYNSRRPSFSSAVPLARTAVRRRVDFGVVRPTGVDGVRIGVPRSLARFVEGTLYDLYEHHAGGGRLFPAMGIWGDELAALRWDLREALGVPRPGLRPTAAGRVYVRRRYGRPPWPPRVRVKAGEPPPKRSGARRRAVVSFSLVSLVGPPDRTVKRQFSQMKAPGTGCTLHPVASFREPASTFADNVGIEFGHDKNGLGAYEFAHLQLYGLPYLLVSYADSYETVVWGLTWDNELSAAVGLVPSWIVED